MVNVDEIHADRGLPEQHLSDPRRRYIDLLEAQNLRATGALKANGTRLHGPQSLRGIVLSVKPHHNEQRAEKDREWRIANGEWKRAANGERKEMANGESRMEKDGE
jgi:hypothetical protein